MGTTDNHEAKPCNSEKKPLILTIDDDENIRMLLSAFLKKHYNVVAKEDGLHGMSWLYQGNIPDLIVVDVDMPRLNGREFLKSIRNSGFFRQIPVIILSGVDCEKTKANCLKNGANDYLKKPFNPEEILTTINSALFPKNHLSHV